jgi:hypothetical protein
VAFTTLSILPLALAPFGRHRDLARAREVLPGDRGRVGGDLGRGALRHDLAAMDARAGADVEDVIGLADRLLVMFDDDHRVALVAQVLQRRQQPVIVALVQADGGLVEHVEHAGQARADLGGQPDALALAARERAGVAAERQVFEPHVVQEAQPLADLLQDRAGDLVLLLAERGGHVLAPGIGLADRHLHDLAHVQAAIFTASASGRRR